MNASQALSILSTLCQLHTSRGQHWREYLPHWQKAFPLNPEALSPRQMRRWQTLSAYWQNQGTQLLNHSLRRQAMTPAEAESIQELAQNLSPPGHPEIQPSVQVPSTALFITTTPWGERYGTCCPLELRQLRYQDRFPPLHLSARFADAAILSSGHLALEALSQFLGKKLALDQDFPLWAEIAFPDHVRLVDESASLAFVGAIMQSILAPEQAGLAFSGLVRRDSGQIEKVQGFDLAYGKLEAAFDAGLNVIYLPQNTVLSAIPAAGIRLKQQSPEHFSYFLDSAPEDQMQIHLISDLEALYQSAFKASAQGRLNSLLTQIPEADPQSGLPGLYAWKTLEERLQNLFPAALQPRLTAFSLSFQQAHELTSAKLPNETAWLECRHKLQDLTHSLMHLITVILASVCLHSGSEQQIKYLLQSLRSWNYPSTQHDWQALLRQESVQKNLERFLPDQQAPLQRLLHFTERLHQSTSIHSLSAFWEHLRYLLHSLKLQDFEPLLNLQYPAHGIALRVPRIQEKALNLSLFQVISLSADLKTCAIYAGLDPQHPAEAVYTQLSQKSLHHLTEVCPLRPQDPFDFQREFQPAHRDHEQNYFLPQNTPIKVHCHISNRSYLKLRQIQFKEHLPLGLEAEASELSWQGSLAPGESIDLSYSLFAPKAGLWQLPAPELSFTLPGEEHPQKALLALPTIALKFESHQQPQIILSRELRAIVGQGLDPTSDPTSDPNSDPNSAQPLSTRQAFMLVIRMENIHAQPAHNLQWHNSNKWPQGLELLTPEARLPQELPAYAHFELSFTLQTHFPGPVELPEWVLHYQGGNHSPCSSSLAAETLQIAFNSQLPPSGREAVYDWLDDQLKNPRCRGIYLYGAEGSGKKHCLQHWDYTGLRLELIGDPYLNVPGATLRQLLIQVLQALDALSLREHERKDALILHDFLHEINPSSDQESLLLAALSRSITVISEQQRLLLQVFHLELLDPLSLKLLRYLMLQGSLEDNSPLFLLLSGQSHQLPDILSDLPLDRRELPTLSPTAIQALLEALFPHNAFPTDLPQRLNELTGGLLFFLQETLAELVEAGQIYTQDQIWHSHDPSEFSIPARIEQLVLKEVQAETEALQALKTAAVLGLDFSLEALAGTLGQSVQALEDLLKHAFQTRILHRRSRQDCRFTHPLYQQILYQLCGEEAPTLHSAVASYLESQPQPAPEVLASHYLRAKEPQLAIRSCFLAGKQNHLQGLLETAQKWLVECIRLLREHPDLENSYAESYHMLGEIAQQTSQRSQARDYFLHFLQLARAQHSGSEICRGLLDLASVSPPEEAAEYLEQALGLAEQLGQTELQYQAQLQMAIYLSETLSLEAARPHFFKAMGSCQPESLEQAKVLETMGYEAIKAGQSAMAENDLLISKQIYAQHRDIQGLASVYNRLGACSFYQQELQRAEHYFSESKNYYQRGGNRLKLSHVQHNLGLLAEARRNYTQAETYYRENAVLALRLQDPRVEGFSRIQLSSVYLKLRDFSRAKVALARAESLMEAIGDQRGQAYLKANQGLLALFEHNLPQAKSCLEAAVQAFEPLQDIMGQDLVALRMGHLHWLSGQIAQAQDYYQRCLASRQNLDRHEEDGLERVYHALALVACHQEHWDQAHTYFQKAEKFLLKSREVSHLAIVTHNLMRLSEQQQQHDQALTYQHKRDVLIGLDRYGISQSLSTCTGFYTILD